MGFSGKDSVLAGQVSNFSTVLAASPETYNQTVATATAVTAAVGAYLDAYRTMVEARANGVRSEAQTATKDATRLEMLNLLRPIYSAAQESVSISDADKLALGVYVKVKRYTRQPTPEDAPLLSVTKVDGRVVTVSVRDPKEPDGKRRPRSVSGISVFSHVGAESPAEASRFKFEQNTGRMNVRVEFPPAVPVGTTVWFTAFFFNRRKQSGPACAAISATLGAGSTMATPASAQAAPKLAA